MPRPEVAQGHGTVCLGLPHDAGLHAGVRLLDEGHPYGGAGNRAGDPGTPEGLDATSQLCTHKSSPCWASGLFWRQGLHLVCWPGAFLLLWAVVLRQRVGPGLVLSPPLPELRSWVNWEERPCGCLAGALQGDSHLAGNDITPTQAKRPKLAHVPGKAGGPLLGLWQDGQVPVALCSVSFCAIAFPAGRPPVGHGCCEAPGCPPRSLASPGERESPFLTSLSHTGLAGHCRQVVAPSGGPGGLRHREARQTGGGGWDCAAGGGPSLPVLTIPAEGEPQQRAPGGNSLGHEGPESRSWGGLALAPDHKSARRK